MTGSEHVVDHAHETLDLLAVRVRPDIDLVVDPVDATWPDRTPRLLAPPLPSIQDREMGEEWATCTGSVPDLRR